MRHSAAVADDVKSLVFGFEVFVNRHFHIVKLDFYAVKERVVISRSGRDFIKSVNHLNYSVQNPFGKHETEISRRCFKSGTNNALVDTLFGTATPPHQVAEALNHNPTPQHVGQTGYAFRITVAVFEGF